MTSGYVLQLTNYAPIGLFKQTLDKMNVNLFDFPIDYQITLKLDPERKGNLTLTEKSRGIQFSTESFSLTE